MENINPTYCNSSIELVQSTFLNNPPLSENNIFYILHSIDTNSCYDSSYEGIINSYNDLFDNGEVPILNSEWYNPTHWLYDSLIEILGYEGINNVAPSSFYDSISLLAYNVATSLPQFFDGDYSYLIADMFLEEDNVDTVGGVDEDSNYSINDNSSEPITENDVIDEVGCSELLYIISQPFESVAVDLRDEYIFSLRDYLTRSECVTNQSNASIIALAIDRVTLMIYNSTSYMDYDANGGEAGYIVSDILSTPLGTPQVIKTSLATFAYNFIYGFDVLDIEEGDSQFEFFFEHLGVTMEQADENLDYITSINIVDEGNLDYTDTVDVIEEDVDYECPTCESCPTTFRLRGVVDTRYGKLSIEGSHNSTTGKTTFKSINEGKPIKPINESKAKGVSKKVKW